MLLAGQVQSQSSQQVLRKLSKLLIPYSNVLRPSILPQAAVHKRTCTTQLTFSAIKQSITRGLAVQSGSCPQPSREWLAGVSEAIRLQADWLWPTGFSQPP